MKKIAVFHNYLGACGGGERLALEIARIFQADFFTTDIVPEVVKNLGCEDINLISLGTTIKFPPAKQISASIFFSRPDLKNKYDFFIFSGEWAAFAAARNRPNLYYCHTPPRIFYDLYHQNTRVLNFFSKIVARSWVYFHKKFEQKNITHIEKIICNSKVTQRRIKEFYNRTSEIIYPFVRCERYRYKEPEGYWLAVNRIYPEKRIELAVEAFRNLPHLELFIVGGFASGDHGRRYFKKIKKNLPANVKILGAIPEKDLIELYGRCRGLVATALDEDFGLTPLEAMASGKPVVAVAEGGFLETVVAGATGYLVAAQPEEIKKAILAAELDLSRFCLPSQAQAAKFDFKFFQEKIIRSVEEP